jgi:hypothetical protein
MVCVEAFSDIVLCRSLLEGCGVILPAGSLTEIYDAKGFRYRLPLFCICEPVNLDGGSESVPGNSVTEAVEGTWETTSLAEVHVRLSSDEDVRFELDPQSRVQQLKLLLQPKVVTVLWRGKILSDDVALESLGLTSKDLLQAHLLRRSTTSSASSGTSWAWLSGPRSSR